MKTRKNSIVCLLLIAAMIASMLVGCADKAENTPELDANATNDSTDTANGTDTTDDQQNDPAELPDLSELVDNIDPATGLVTDIENYGSNTVTALSAYSITEAVPNDSNMSAVVAVTEKGEVCLTNAQLQIYYWMEFYNFMNSYGSYASMLGLDTTQPLYLQASMQEGSTWEQYFLEAAAKHYNENYALAQAAYENGYVISEEEEANIADMNDPDGTFAAEATEYGYESVDAYVQANFGPGITVEDYQEYLRTYYAASYYYTSQKEAYVATLTEADVEAHFDENIENFDGLTKVNNIKVRHILIGVEGETDENGEYSAEAWAAAEATANEIYEQWKTDPTEDNFIELAKTHSTDPGSKDNGGLYDDVYPGQMVEAFNDWCFEESRQVGDHDIVKTNYGYHIMYFVGQSENRQWYTAAEEDIVAVTMNALLDEIIEQYPLLFDYNKVRIYDMVTASTVAE